MVKKTTKSRRIEDKPFPRSTFETIDSAMYKFLDDVLDISCVTTTGFRKVPIVWSGAERMYQSKRDQRIRDRDGSLVLPLITVERTNVTKDPTKKGTVFANIPPMDKVKGGSISVSRKINQKKTSNFANATARRKRKQLNFPGKNEKVVYQTMTIPLPIYVTVQYEITLKTEYQEQMNQMMTPFITKPGGINYVIIEEGRLRYEAFIQEDFSHNNNIRSFTSEERKFETKVTIEVLGWVTGEDANSLQPDFAIQENAVEIKIPRERIVLADQLLEGNGKLFGLEGIDFPAKVKRAKDPVSSFRSQLGGSGGDAEQARGPQGPRGISVTKAELVNFELIISLSDGTVFNLGNVRGDTGAGFVGGHGLNNQMITADGAGNIVAESNITFNGNELAVAGDMSITGIVRGGSPLKVSGAIAIVDELGSTVALLGASSLGPHALSASVVSGRSLIGSLTKLDDGTDYLRAGAGISLSTGSSGAVTITSTGGGGGGDLEGNITTTNYIANSTFQEVPNGSRTTFTVSNAFVAGTQMVFRDGVLMMPGADNDYTVTNTTTIEFNSLSPPQSDTNLLITYVRA